MIQTIAHQPWVLGHKVGMIGVSYGAISQLFTAQLDPPALEAISPLSTLDSTITTLYPGGILNTGFALSWAAERQVDAQPASPTAGESWAYKRIAGGDTSCRHNQALHAEAPSVLKLVRDNSHYVAKVDDPLDPVTFVHKIKAAVFMACQWEDEQTGGHCADLAQDFTGTRNKWFTFTNGAHIDSLDPATFDRWYDFLSLFVAHQAPCHQRRTRRYRRTALLHRGAGDQRHDTAVDPIQQIPTYSAALAAYEKLPSVRVLFDDGAGAAPNGTITPGDPYPGFEQSFPSFPIPGTVAQAWYFGAGGSLATSPDPTPETDTFTWNPRALPATDFPTYDTSAGGLWGNAADWGWNWQQNPAGTAVSYVSQPLTQNTTVIGGGALHVWIKATSPSVDLQATVSEVRPDGMETFVQDGWVRADERRLATGEHDARAGAEPAQERRAGAPERTLRRGDDPALLRGPRLPSRLADPRHDRGAGRHPALWAFAQTSPAGTAAVSLEFSAADASSLVLPVVPGVSVPTGLPPCPSLRNEPCRAYVPLVNRTSGS